MCIAEIQMRPARTEMSRNARVRRLKCTTRRECDFGRKVSGSKWKLVVRNLQNWVVCSTYVPTGWPASWRKRPGMKKGHSVLLRPVRASGLVLVEVKKILNTLLKISGFVHITE